MKNINALPYLYIKLFKSFSYSVERWLLFEKTSGKSISRATSADFYVTREFLPGEFCYTWAVRGDKTFKLELSLTQVSSEFEERERLITIKYGNSCDVTPEKVSVRLPITAKSRAVKKRIYLMLKEIALKNHVH